MPARQKKGLPGGKHGLLRWSVEIKLKKGGRLAALLGLVFPAERLPRDL